MVLKNTLMRLIHLTGTFGGCDWIENKISSRARLIRSQLRTGRDLITLQLDKDSRSDITSQDFRDPPFPRQWGINQSHLCLLQWFIHEHHQVDGLILYYHPLHSRGERKKSFSGVYNNHRVGLRDRKEYLLAHGACCSVVTLEPILTDNHQSSKAIPRFL